MARPSRPPAYRLKSDHGLEYAVVTLTDALTGKRQDVRLGDYGTDESRAAYGRAVAAWESAGRRLPGEPTPTPAGPTVTSLVGNYMASAVARYSDDELHSIRAALRVVVQLYGPTPANAFGPNALRLVRDSMVRGQPDDEADPRKSWSRPTVQARVERIRRCFKWGVAHEIVAETTYRALTALEPLRRGRSEAREPDPVRPVDTRHVETTIEHVAPQVAAMIRLQLLTGMRPGEVVAIRTVDVDTAAAVWVYRPTDHKTAWRGHVREIPLGPQAQAVLKPWLRTDVQGYVFRPDEAAADRLEARHARRRTPAGQGTERGDRHVNQRQRPPGDRYTVSSYRRAIVRGCDAADRAARPRPTCETCGRVFNTVRFLARHALRKHGVELESPPAVKRLVPRWHPHQLRHTYATEVRRRYGVEAAQVLLGHASIDATLIYAEKNLERGREIAAKIG